MSKRPTYEELLHKVHQLELAETERLKTEEALNRSHALHKNLIGSIPDLVWLKDQDGVYLSCNKAFENLYGATEANIIGKTDYDFGEKEQADFFRQNDRKAVEKNAPNSNEEWLTFAADGYCGLFETVKTPLRDPDGTFIGILGIARDVTSRQQTELALRESEERFRSLHDASFGGIAIHDKGVILECNQGLATMTGFSVEELIGMDGLLLIAQCDRAFVMQKIVSGFELPYEATGLCKNGDEYSIRLEARNVPYKGRQVRTVEFRDLTELKQAEYEQERLQEQLDHARKMESVGQLAGGVAHDFNNLLQVILGFGEVALDEKGASKQIRDSVEQIMKAGERARSLVGQLLAFSRRQVLDMKGVALNEVISEMLKILRRVIGEHINLSFEPGENLDTVLADSGQIGQIITNLCVNSRDSMPGGGTVTIATENTLVVKENAEEHFWVEPGKYVCLSVSDTGVGIDPSMLEHIFEPFFTTKDVDQGTGLGLSTVYGLVKQHHGSVHVQSELGQGTTFKIYLPAAELGAAVIHQKPFVAAGGGTETILLAEDDDMVRKLTCTLLERAGYKVLEACNGVEAVEVFENNSDQIDMLLLDVIMPKQGGKVVYDRVREMNPKMPALFSSGYSMNVVHTDFILNEGLELVQKPSTREELLRKVREVLDGSKLKR